MKKKKLLAVLSATMMSLSVLLTSGITAKAEEVDIPDSEIIKNDETGIPDQNLYKAALQQFDSNGDGILTKDEAATGKALSAVNCSIENLQGIQYFENVLSLSLSENQISDISALSSLNNLAGLNLSYNNISDISALSNLTNLSSLDLSGNQISDISALSNLTNLTHLDLSVNQISDISPLERHTQLGFLNLTVNQVSDISVLSNHTNLSMLFAAGNQISDISPLLGLTRLSGLSLGDNQISDISPLLGLTRLSSLSLEDNQISDISVLSNLTNLTGLQLSNNQISDISALSNLTELGRLELANNKISNISALSNFTEFEELDLTGNQISDISPLTNLERVGTLLLAHNQISELPDLDWNWILILDLRYNNISDLSAMKDIEFKIKIEGEYTYWAGAFGLREGTKGSAGYWDSRLDPPNTAYWKIAEGNPITREHEIAMLPASMVNAKIKEFFGNAVLYSWLESEGFVTANVIEDTVISSDEFAALLEANQTEDIVIKSGEDVLFIFKQGTMKAIDGIDNYDFSVAISKDYSKITGLPSQVTGSNFVARIDYNYSGKLPATASIQIYIGKDYAGQKLYYSQLMSDTSVALVQAVTVDEEGYITVTQDHCSSYIVTKEALNSEEATTTTEAPKAEATTTATGTTATNGTPATGDSAMPWVYGALAVSALAALIALKRKTIA